MWGGRGRTSLRARVFAICATVVSQVCRTSRQSEFDKLRHQYDVDDDIKDPTKFIHKSWTRFLDEDTLDDRPRSGRPHLVDESIAREVADLLKEGHVINGNKVYYHTIEEACMSNPVIAALVEASGHDAEHVFKRAKEVDPDLTERVRHIKMELPPHIKEEREQVAADKLKLSWVTLFNVVFIDEMKLELMPPITETVICSRGEQIFAAEDARLNKKRKHEKPIIIHAIYAVNAIMGPVHMRFLTGTTGIDTKYMVRFLQAYTPCDVLQIHH